MGLNNAIITVTVGDKQKEKFLINLPNIRNLQGYLKGFWDFDAFASDFPARNKLSDVDGSIELNGHTLHIEFKSAKVAMNKGQVLKAIRQAKYSNITTLFVLGETDKPVEYLEISPNYPEGSGYKPLDIDGLHTILKDWVVYTKENNLVTDRTAEWNIATRYC